MLSKVWPLCMAPGNVTSGCEATRIYSFNSYAISEEDFQRKIKETGN
jgi:hypothetical protein